MGRCSERWIRHLIVLAVAGTLPLLTVGGRFVRHAVEAEAGVASSLGASEGSAVIELPHNAVYGTLTDPTAPVQSCRLLDPLSGVVTQGFGPSHLAFEPAIHAGGAFYPHFHTGLDIAAPLGTTISAADDGRVEYAGRSGGYGLVVLLRHAGGLRTLYAHLSRALVHVGEAVQAGRPIGLEGSTGMSTGPHLHFEVRPAQRLVADPVPYLRADCPVPGGGVAVPALPATRRHS